MRKAKEIANEICVVYADAIMQENWQLFTKKLSDVFMEVAVKDTSKHLLDKLSVGAVSGSGLWGMRF